ncbi:GGDEF domain-containing response regulator [Kiloniella majae]|uniref:GGDEF domain-containing response regulator n=1 Tax=Kiloniella majae TaxID=1938558 RepID=UPI000A2787DB|nr:GGDEF domain-containing response regulator [Kiloniella majae]
MEQVPQNLKTKILIVDDNEGDRLLIEALLSHSSNQYDFQWTRSVAEAKAVLEDNANIQAALVDYNLNDGKGIELLQHQSNQNEQCPCIVMTGLESAEVDHAAMEAGAADFLPKNEMTGVLLERTIRYAIEQDQVRQTLRQKNIELKRAQMRLEAQNLSIAKLAEHLTETALEKIDKLRKHTNLPTSDLHDLQKTNRLAIWQVTYSGQTLFMNNAMTKWFYPFSGGDLSDRSFASSEELSNISFASFPDYFIEQDRGLVATELTKWQRGQVTSFEATLRLKDKRSNKLISQDRHVIVSAATTAPHDNLDDTLLITMVDITKRRVIEKSMQELLHRDDLTGLYNRLAFNEFLPTAVANADRNNYMVGVLYLDINGFKNVNDTYGHQIGDQLLQKTAKKLDFHTRISDITARLSGDEFGIILNNLHCENDAAEVALNILEGFKDPITIDDQTILIDISIGISLYPLNGADPETLIRNADLALYRAKKLPGANYGFFDSEMLKKISNRRNVEHSLRLATHNFKQFSIHYQPQVNALDGQLTGVEALIRWNHPERGPLLPGDFLTVAEQTGLILPIGTWVLNQACKQLREWQLAKHPITSLAVNMSAIQLYQEDTVDKIRKAIMQSGCNPAGLVLELTENIVLKDLITAKKIINELRDLDIRIALDDFGTGHSSLSLLKELSVDILKIDRSFVKDIHSHNRNTIIVKNLTRMAQDLGISVVAEGVETAEEFSTIKECKCEHIQGFLFGKPLDLDALERWTSKNFTPETQTLN